MTTIALLAIGFIALAMLVMAVGVIFKNRCLRGSCGGVGVRGPGGELLTCDACPRKGDADCAETLDSAQEDRVSQCNREEASQLELTLRR